MSNPLPAAQVDPRHQPRYHFRPAANWMNDPNGLIQWKGRYHMFYQYQPAGAFHSGAPDGSFHPIVWGHAASSDLARWEILPTAMEETAGWHDEHGVYSGCAVNHQGAPTFIYTGHRTPRRMGPDAPHRDRNWIETPLLATGDAELLKWEKRPEPLIREPADQGELTGFRDHCVWLEDGLWHQLIGSGVRGQGGVVFLYTSHDLLEWEFRGPILTGDREHPLEPGRHMWECPDMCSVGKRRMLVVSNCSRTIYYLGHWDGTRLTPDPGYPRLLDHGTSFYAPQSFSDADGRRIMFGWLREARPAEQQIRAGWSGVMSLPWIIDADGQGELRIAPAPEIADLRRANEGFSELELSPACPEVRLDLETDTFEMDLEFVPRGARRFGVKVLCTPDGDEETVIAYHPREGKLSVDRSKSSAEDGPNKSAESGDLKLRPDEPLRLRVFVDRSVIEIFANERTVLTTRVYPTRDDAVGIELFAAGGEVAVPTLDIWRMESIW